MILTDSKGNWSGGKCLTHFFIYLQVYLKAQSVWETTSVYSSARIDGMKQPGCVCFIFVIAATPATMSGLMLPACLPD